MRRLQLHRLRALLRREAARARAVRVLRPVRGGAGERADRVAQRRVVRVEVRGEQPSEDKVDGGGGGVEQVVGVPSAEGGRGLVARSGGGIWAWRVEGTPVVAELVHDQLVGGEVVDARRAARHLGRARGSGRSE